jgi:hypothetical protein
MQSAMLVLLPVDTAAGRDSPKGLPRRDGGGYWPVQIFW